MFTYANRKGMKEDLLKLKENKKRNQINEHFPYLFCSLFLPDKERK